MFGYAQQRRPDPTPKSRRTEGGSNLAWNAWIAPTSGGATYFPVDVNPITGRSTGQREITHDSWLRQYAEWLQENHELTPPEEDDFVGSTAIGRGWIRKAGHNRYLTYTISPEDAGRSLRLIRDNIWDHISSTGGEMNLSRIPVVITVLKTPAEMPTVAEFTLQDFVNNDGDLRSLVRYYQARNRTGNRPSRTAMAIASVATEMERLGQHDLADRMDDLIRTAQVDDRGLPTEVSQRWRSTRDYYEPFRRSIIPRMMATERMLSNSPDEYSAAQQALDRWNAIINQPGNVNDLANWIATGQMPIGAIEEERTPGRKFHELTAAWAMEDAMMDPLARRLGEPGLEHHSPRDKDRLVTWYDRRMGRPPRGSIEADFRSTDPESERLYELKTRLRRGPFEIKKNVVPGDEGRDRLQLIVQRMNELGKIDPRTREVAIPSVGRVEMFTPSWDEVQGSPLDVRGRSYVVDPRDPMASARIDREDIEDAIEELHGGKFVGRGKHSPQWNRDLEDWAENVLGRVRKMVPR